MNRFQARQGDVFIQEVTEIDKMANEHPMDNGRHILAYGEITGHAHAITETEGVTMFNRDGQLWLKTDKPTEVRHEEHGAITIPKGLFKITIQREYHPEGIRNVLD